MSNIKIFHFFPKCKDIAAMQQSESLLVPPNPDSPDSSLSPHHQEDNEYKRQRKHQHQQQDQEEEEEEQEKLQDGSRGKRKWECVDEASYVEIPQTPRISNSECYCPPRPPRKPKTFPAMKGRAKWVKRSVVLLDVAREVDSMFPSSVLQDFGKKIKKARF